MTTEGKTGPLRLVALVLGVAIVAVVAVYLVKGGGAGRATGESCVDKQVVEVRGIIGSEKEEFFRDPDVVARFQCLGVRLVVDSRGSLEMVKPLERGDHGYAFAFPGSRTTAREILADPAVRHGLPALDPYEVFSSPMVVATLSDAVAALRASGDVRSVDDHDVVDLTKVLARISAGTTWSELSGRPSAADKTPVLLHSTDPDASNSGFLLLAAAAWAGNGHRAEIGAEHMAELATAVCPLFAAQGGSKPIKSQDLFDQYAGQNPRTPMAFVYESQYLSAKVRPEGHSLLYPDPGISSVHTLIALDPRGQRVGQLLRDDDDLVRLVAEHGFRPQGRTVPGGADPSVTAAESPSFDEMRTLVDQLVAKRASGKRCGA